MIRKLSETLFTRTKLCVYIGTALMTLGVVLIIMEEMKKASI